MDRSFGRARAAVAGAFAAHAVISGSLGPWIPRLKAAAGLDPAGLGIALTGYAVGLLVGTRAAGPCARGAGARMVLRAGIPVLAGSLALLPLARGLISLTAIFATLGLAAGLIDVAMNTEAVAIERRFGRRVMSSMHGTWSLFVLAGAAAASIGVAAGIPIGVHLPAVAALIVVTGFPVMRWLPEREVIETRAPSATQSPAPAGRIALLCLIAGTVFLAEGIAIEWSALYLRELTGAGTAGLGVVSFSAGMVASRFVADRFTARIDQSLVIRGGAASGALALATALIAGGAVPMIVALGILGLGLGPIVPSVFRAAGDRWLRAGRSALPIVVTAGYAGSIVGPLVVGFVADLVDLRAAFALPVVACIAAVIAAGAARDR